MATIDYGVDLMALDDLPDPEVLCSGATNVGYALGRRLLEPTGTMEEIGDPAPYDSINIREWLGERLSDADLRARESRAAEVLYGDERVRSVTVTLTFAAGVLTLTAWGEGSSGPFRLVVTVDEVTAKIMET